MTTSGIFRSDMETYQINISGPNDKGPNENFFFQQFSDYNSKKVREVIRIINEFPPPKRFVFEESPCISTQEFNVLYDKARLLAEATGNSYNHELVNLVNQWFKERL